MDTVVQKKSPAFKAKFKVKLFIFFSFIFFTITISMDYDGGSLMTYFFFFILYYIFHKFSSKLFNKIRKRKEKKCSTREYNSLLFFSILFIFSTTLGYIMVESIVSGKSFLKFIFLIFYIGFGLLLANIVMQVVYSFDNNLAQLNNSLTKKHDSFGREVNYFHLLGFYYFKRYLGLAFFVLILNSFCFSNDPSFYDTFFDVIFYFCQISFFLILYNFLRTRYPEINTFNRPKDKFIFIAVILGIVVYFFTGILSDLNDYYIINIIRLPEILPEEAVYYDYYGYDVESVTATILHFFSAVIIAPFLEELIFRGFLYNIFKKRYGITVGVIVSTTIFALLHGNTYYRFIPMILTCMFMPYLYEKSKSLIPPIITHSVYNLIVVIF